MPQTLLGRRRSALRRRRRRRRRGRRRRSRRRRSRRMPTFVKDMSSFLASKTMPEYGVREISGWYYTQLSFVLL